MHHDPLWMRVLLALHVAGGSLAFVLAPIALLTAKGGKAHRRWGMVYSGRWQAWLLPHW